VREAMKKPGTSMAREAIAKPKALLGRHTRFGEQKEVEDEEDLTHTMSQSLEDKEEKERKKND